MIFSHLNAAISGHQLKSGLHTRKSFEVSDLVVACVTDAIKILQPVLDSRGRLPAYLQKWLLAEVLPT
jgi:hypothetical protein